MRTKPPFCRAIGLVLLLGLAACGVGKPQTELPDRDQIKTTAVDQWGATPAIRQIPANADLFISRSIRPAISGKMGQQDISLKFNSSRVTLNDLAYLLEQQDISIVFVDNDQNIGSSKSSDSSSNKTDTKATVADSGTLEDRKVPFRRYKGTLQGLITKIKRSMNIAVWWENNSLFVAEKDRYAVAIPQYQDIMDQVASELETLGAEQITPSLYSGRIVYTARPSTNIDTIQPYLRSLSNNLAEITFQLAVVQLTLSDEAERGFDWSSFNIQFGDPALAAAGSALKSPQGTLATLLPFAGKSLFDNRSNTSGRLGGTLNSKLWGKNRIGITGAINYLSQFGRTNTRQTIELRTLAGMPVELRSGNTTPYVKSIGATTTPGSTTTTTGSGTSSSGNVTGSVDTGTLETGLNLTLTPYYDAAIGLVTVEFDAKVNSLIELVTLSAGNQLGSITQPSTQENRLNDIVRVPAGDVVILGGIRQEQEQNRRTAPLDMFDTVGSNATKKDTSLTFFILRPVVTVYALNDSQANANLMGSPEDYGFMKKAETKENNGDPDNAVPIEPVTPPLTPETPVIPAPMASAAPVIPPPVTSVAPNTADHIPEDQPGAPINFSDGSSFLEQKISDTGTAAESRP